MVTGLGGRSVSARGSGSVTLTDQMGNKYTIKNVLYVPDHDSNLLSMMQLQRQGLNFAFKPYDYSFSGAFSLSSRTTAFQLDGEAVDDILYTREASTPPPTPPRALVVTTRKRAREIMEEENQDENQDENSSVSNEIDQPIRRRRLATSSDSETSSPSEAPTPPRPPPLQCSPNNLWHLCFAHASQYTLAKHPGIESRYDTSDCLACRRGKHQQSPHHPSKNCPREIVELIHSQAWQSEPGQPGSV
jgi:hypothetical protein